MIMLDANAGVDEAGLISVGEVDGVDAVDDDEVPLAYIQQWRPRLPVHVARRNRQCLYIRTGNFHMFDKTRTSFAHWRSRLLPPCSLPAQLRSSLKAHLLRLQGGSARHPGTNTMRCSANEENNRP